MYLQTIKVKESQRKYKGVQNPTEVKNIRKVEYAKRI